MTKVSILATMSHEISFVVQRTWIHFVCLVHVHLTNEYLIICFWPSWREDEKYSKEKFYAESFVCLRCAASKHTTQVMFCGSCLRVRTRSKWTFERERWRNTRACLREKERVSWIWIIGDIMDYIMMRDKHCYVKYAVSGTLATAEQHCYGCTCYNVSKRLKYKNASIMRRWRQTATHRKHCIEYQTNTETMVDSDNSVLSAVHCFSRISLDFPT